MKRSVNRLSLGDGFMVVLSTLSEYLSRGWSCPRGLDHQPFGGGTGPFAAAASRQLRRQDGLHPPLSARLAMSATFPHTSCPLFLQPELGPHRRAERRRADHEAHAAIQNTAGRVVFLGRDGRSRPIAWPRLTHTFDGPAPGVDGEHRVRRPNCCRYLGHQEMPGQQFQRRLRRRIALCLGLLPCCSAARMDHQRWNP